MYLSVASGQSMTKQRYSSGASVGVYGAASCSVRSTRDSPPDAGVPGWYSLCSPSLAP